VWEPLFWAKTVLADLPESVRQAYAERALTELFDEGRIFFFKIEPGESPEAAFERGSQPLDRMDVDATIGGSSWRTWPLGESSIFFGGTVAGELAVREHWPGTTTPSFRAGMFARTKPDAGT